MRNDHPARRPPPNIVGLRTTPNIVGLRTLPKTVGLRTSSRTSGGRPGAVFLIEILVATTLLVVATGVAVRMTASSIRRDRLSHQRAIATVQADNVLDQLKRQSLSDLRDRSDQYEQTLAPDDAELDIRVVEFSGDIDETGTGNDAGGDNDAIDVDAIDADATDADAIDGVRVVVTVSRRGVSARRIMWRLRSAEASPAEPTP